MSNGSERMSERPRITNWVENVPVRGLSGEIIGRARVSDKGQIQATLSLESAAKNTYQFLTQGLSDSLTIVPRSKPAIKKEQ